MSRTNSRTGTSAAVVVLDRLMRQASSPEQGFKVRPRLASASRPPPEFASGVLSIPAIHPSRTNDEANGRRIRVRQMGDVTPEPGSLVADGIVREGRAKRPARDAVPVRRLVDLREPNLLQHLSWQTSR